jgi:hypothetical protein
VFLCLDDGDGEVAVAACCLGGQLHAGRAAAHDDEAVRFDQRATDGQGVGDGTEPVGVVVQAGHCGPGGACPGGHHDRVGGDGAAVVQQGGGSRGIHLDDGGTFDGKVDQRFDGRPAVTDG